MKQLRDGVGASMGRRLPLYRRRRFWLGVGLITVLAAGVAAYFFTKSYPVSQSTDTKTGRIEVHTNPDGATVLLDGKDTKQRSSATLTTRVGKHLVTLQLATYDEQEIEVTVRDNETSRIDHTFSRGGQSVLPSPAAGQAAFQTYTNGQYGYAIDYPSSWSVTTDSSGVAHFSSSKEKNAEAESLAILVQPNPQNLDPKAWYETREEYPSEDQNKIAKRSLTINGRPAYQYDSPYGFFPATYTVFTGKSQSFLLQIVQGSPDRAVYDQIIKTFRLL